MTFCRRIARRGRGLLAWAALAAALPFVSDAAASAGFNDNIDRTDPNFVKASLLVVDPGEVMYSCFGHAVIRLECPRFNLDYCFSYESENILANKWRFFWGDLKMGMFAIPTQEFLKVYAAERRGVKQYGLNLPPDAKQRLWQHLDGKVAEGVRLKYDQVARCCAQSVFRQIRHALGETRVDYAVWPDGFEGTKTRREIARDFIRDEPWTSFVMSAVSGSLLDENCPKGEKIIIPEDLLTVLKGAKINGVPIVSGEGVVLLPSHPLSEASWCTPMVIALAVLALAVVNLFLSRRILDLALLSVYAVFGMSFFLLVCISSLPTNGWNWMLVPFNPLPLVFWRWRRVWGVCFAGVLAAFAVFVSLMPHRITEWPYVVFVAGFALLFAKPWLGRVEGKSVVAPAIAVDGYCA